MLLFLVYPEYLSIDVKMLYASSSRPTIEEIMLTWGSDMDDVEELRVFAERVLPEV